MTTKTIGGITLYPAPVRGEDRLAAVMTNYRNQAKYAQDDQGHIIGLNLENQGLTNAQWGAFLAALPEQGKHLQALKLSGNKLTKLDIGPEFSRLKYLDISQNKRMKDLSLSAPLKHLEKLNAAECALEGAFCIPEGMEKLARLNLNRNKLTEMRFDGDCPLLEALELSRNKLARFRLPIGFSALRFLSLKNNSLTELHIPSPLRSLTTLDVRNNQLGQLPEDLLSYTSLHTLLLHGNRWQGVIGSYVSGGKENTNFYIQIRDYLNEQSKGELINNRVKIIILGNGRVGKTSLFKRLKGLPYDPQEKLTHGVHLGTLEKEHLPNVTTDKLHANVWDFGGQEVFYATHQFFLTDNSVYILAWTVEENVKAYRAREEGTLAFEEKWRDNEYWLENIRQYSPDIPILMVQTHVDKGKSPVQEESMQREYKAFCLDFSATSEEKPAAILRKMEEVINNHISTFGEKVAQTFDAVIGAIEKRKNDNKITWDTFVNVICKEAGITPGAEQSVLDYLVFTGTAVWYKDKLKDTIFINPNWLTQQAYRIVSTELVDKKGRFDYAWVDAALPEMQPAERAEMLELLIAFELIFEAEGKFWAPQFLPEQLPDDTQREFNKTKRRLSSAFRFCFPKFVPDNVMVNFVSRYGPYSDKVFWRNGISFTKKMQEPHEAEKEAKWLDAIVEFDPAARTLSVFAESGTGSYPLLSEICHAFVELSRNANADIALPGRAFVSWQTLKEAYDNKDEKVIATDKSRIPMADFEFIFNPNKKEGDKATEKPDESSEREADKPNEDTSKDPQLVRPKIRPAILMAFAKNDLAGPVQEAQWLCKSVQANHNVKAITIENADIDTLAETIIDHSRNMLMFHYGGHADQHKIVLDGFRDLDKIRLSRLLIPQEQYGPALVFLNGCLSYGQVGLLTAKGVKAIIATNVKVDDAEAVRLAKFFYKCFFEQQYTLKAAFEFAEATVKGSNSHPIVVNPGEIDEKQLMPASWMLFINTHHNMVLNWTLADFIANFHTEPE